MSPSPEKAALERAATSVGRSLQSSLLLRRSADARPVMRPSCVGTAFVSLLLDRPRMRQPRHVAKLRRHCPVEGVGLQVENSRQHRQLPHLRRQLPVEVVAGGRAKRASS